MKTKHLAAVAAASLATAVAPVAAGAEETATPPPSTSTAKVIGSAKANKKGTKATFKVRYTCSTATALWVSLKQSKSGKKDPALKGEGSSAKAASWLQSHRNSFTCDGKQHKKKFTVDLVEPGSKGKLRNGKAWYQFCLSTGEDQIEVYKVGWIAVSR